jgi:hypothetical protein
MKKEEAENKLEFIETSELEKAHGLRRIKRRHYTGPIEQLPDLNVVSTSLLLEKLTERLLNDADFVDRLREKLAA